MYLYEATRALGLACWLRPVVTVEEPNYDDDGEEYHKYIFVGKELHKFTQSVGCGYEAEFTLTDDLRSGAEYSSSFWPSIEMDKNKVTWARDVEKSPSEAAFGFVTVIIRLYPIFAKSFKLTDCVSMVTNPAARLSTHKLRCLCTFRRSRMVSVWMAI